MSVSSPSRDIHLQKKRAASKVEIFCAQIAAILVLAALVLLGMALFGALIPDTPQFTATFARMLDSLAPHLLLASLGPLLLLALIGYRRSALVLAVVACLGGAWLLSGYLRMRAPAGQETDLTVLWFNLLHENATPPEELADAIAASGADIVMIGEAAPLRGVLGRLAAAYPHQVGCAGEVCASLVLSRLPLAGSDIAGFAAPGEERLIHVRPDIPASGPATAPALDLVTAHLVKPWYLGFTGSEADRLDWVLRRYKGPLVVAGDFNAAPWSRRMRQIHRDYGLDFSPYPVPTWPAGAGGFGVPIDHVMVRGGARVASLTPWGADLGSNHRGLLAGIDLP